MSNNIGFRIKASNFVKSHRNIFSLIVGESLVNYTTNIMYAILPVLIAGIFNEWIAGLFLGVFNFIQVLTFDPVTGNLSDRYGSKRLMIIGNFLLLIGALILFFMSVTKWSLILFSFALFLSFSLRSTIETYVLRVIKRDEGGFIFGLLDNFYSTTTFIATLMIPFFIINDNYKIAMAIMSFFTIINMISIYTVKDDIYKIKSRKKVKIKDMINPFNSVKHGIHFVKKNHKYPVMMIAAAVFQGIFYGGIWFLFPVHFSSLGTGSFIEGLQLGIYEVVTIFIASIAGYLADKYNWRHIHSYGWLLVLLGVIAMPFYPATTALIFIGFIIAIGNNLFYYAAEHALEANDVDHKEDGSFVSLKNMCMNSGYGIAPVITGFLYFNFSFTAGLAFISVVCSILAIWMIYMTWKFEKIDY